MRQSNLFLRSLTTNWLALLANVAVSFVLTPFIVDVLGSVFYGAWSLLISLTGYLGLAEVGVMVSVGRFVNFHLGRGDVADAHRVVSTAIAFFTLVCAGLLPLALTLGGNLDLLFPAMPPHVLTDGAVLLLCLVANLYLGLISSVYTILLQTKERFDLVNFVRVTALVFRAVATWMVLDAGFGLVGLAFVVLAAGLFTMILLLLLNAYFGFRSVFRLEYVRLQSFTQLIKFGGWATLSNANVQVVSYMDSILIAYLIGAEPLAKYAIAIMLVDYTYQLVAQAGSVIGPRLTQRVAAGHDEEVRTLVITNSRIAALLAIPALGGVAFYGEEFMRLWMGAEFGGLGLVIVILVLARATTIVNQALGAVLWSMGLVKTVAIASAISAVVNVFLSVLFVSFFDLGLAGIAFGTLIPMSVQNIGFFTFYGVSKIKLRSTSYLRATMLWWAPVAALFCGMAMVARQILPPESWVSFIGSTMFAVSLYLPVFIYLISRRLRRGIPEAAGRV